MELNNLLSRWAKFFLERYRITLLIVIALIVAGLWGTFANQRQDFPTIDSNYITISAVYPGASAEDVEKDVVAPIEQAVTEISGIKNIRSTSSANIGFIWVEMKEIDGTEEAVADADDIVTRLPLPEDVETNVELMDVIGPSLIYAIGNDSVPKDQLLTYAESIKERLAKSSPEILKVDIAPENEFVVRIKLDAETLNENNIQSAEVTEAIQSAVSSLPGGSLMNETGEELSITINPAVQSLDELKEIQIGSLALDELAEISYEPKQMDAITLAGYLKDGEPVSQDAVYLMVYKKTDGDLISLSEAIAEEAEEIGQEDLLPENTDLALVYDNSVYVEAQINALLENGFLGLLLVLIVLMFFINIRTGIAVASIIPLAFLGTLAILYGLGYTINILTLFGLLIVIGILVDNAIVIAEGAVHRIEKGQKKYEAIVGTIKDLGPAVTAATLTTIVAFIPFASISGIVGEFLRYVPITIIIMLVMSYFLAITIMPLIAWMLFREETRETRRARKIKTWQKVTVIPALILGGQKGIDRLEDYYGIFSTWIHQKLWRKLLFVLSALFLFIGSVGLFGSQIPFEEFPTNDTNALMIEFEFPQNMPTKAQNQAIEDVMENTIGTTYFKSYVNFEGAMLVLFEEPEFREPGFDIYVLQEELEGRIAEKVTRLEEQGVQVLLKEMGAGPPTSNYDVIVELRGMDLNDLNLAAKNLRQYIEEKEGIEKISVSSDRDAVETIIVDLDEERLSDNGVDPFIASILVNNLFSEKTIGSITQEKNGTSDDILISYTEESKQSIDDINELIVGVSTGFPPTRVEIQDVADVKKESSLKTIQRLDQQRLVAIQVKVAEDADAVALESEIKEYIAENIDQYNLDAEDVAYGGYMASFDESFDNLVLVFLLAIIIVFLILVYQFNSFVQPGLIMLTVPLAMIGVFPGLFGIDSSLNMVSGLGIIALVGIVVNDAIVFVDYMNRMRRENLKMPIQEIVIETGRARFKPILSTSITTIFGVLPLTLFDPFWRGLGTALMTGLFCATIGTLFVFPILLAWNDKLQKWIAKHMRKPIKKNI